MELAEDGLSCLMPDAAGNGHDKGGIPTSRVSEALACPCAVSGRSSGYGMSGGRGGVLCRPGGGSGWENPGQESAAGVRRAASVWEAAKAGVSTRRPRPKGMAARWPRMIGGADTITARGLGSPRREANICLNVRVRLCASLLDYIGHDLLCRVKKEYTDGDTDVRTCGKNEEMPLLCGGDSGRSNQVQALRRVSGRVCEAATADGGSDGQANSAVVLPHVVHPYRAGQCRPVRAAPALVPAPDEPSLENCGQRCRPCFDVASHEGHGAVGSCAERIL